ncbi:alpha/beta fold hydrolase [Streptacidiphilus jiangxiensis]|uniref:Pimeloyl-ACP methyl ester carboxylesterase n=1 Tax=Streptacidiphilus jiangxiensis TaxID=235985 RepID=A0A1H7HN35_STRJI|nr:alpha/beta hydrolase [Streptacidiphilus jiangxiensis]SEK51047.1 Pimeloyl-ACP methyl ester carboxylesterase [Streptacidiphilus jiangxiensis]
MTAHLASRDGTTLAVDTIGHGAPLVLVGGAFNDRSTVAGLAVELAPRFTAVSYDRRRRGASDDRADEYRVAAELDDLAAVIAHVGGRAAVFGHSSGAALALDAAAQGLPVDRVAVYEPSFCADPSLPRPAVDVLDRLTALLASGDAEGATELFLGEVIGVPGEALVGMRESDNWPFLVEKAPSLPYDLLLSEPWRLLPPERLSGIGIPTLAAYGDRTSPWLSAAARAVATTVPGAELHILPGEDHSVLQRPKALEPLLREFFG